MTLIFLFPVRKRRVRKISDFLHGDFQNLAAWQHAHRDKMKTARGFMNELAECITQSAMADLQCSQLTTVRQGDEKLPVTAEELFYLKRMSVVTAPITACFFLYSNYVVCDCRGVLESRRSRSSA
jgi:hypothetical protein